MNKEARDEFLTGLAHALDTHLADDTRPSLHQLWAALDTATQGWTVKRDCDVVRDDAGYQDSGDVRRESVGTVRQGSILHVTTPWRPETADETADREARAAAHSWSYRAHWFSYDPQDPGWDNGEYPPPPERVSVSQLLDQGLWWRARASTDISTTGAGTCGSPGCTPGSWSARSGRRRSLTRRVRPKLPWRSVWVS